MLLSEEPRHSQTDGKILVSDAKSMFEKGRSREGEAYLFEGLRKWSATVTEFSTMLWILVGAVLLIRYRSSSAP